MTDTRHIFTQLQRIADEQGRQFAGVSVRGIQVKGHDGRGHEFGTVHWGVMNDRVRSEIRHEALVRGLDVR